MSGDNLFVDFERYENGKINIIEIFNITGFFKVYFKNSAIGINKYYFRVTDNFHKPAEKMYISGENILINKFTLNRYLQLIIDGNLDYKDRVTPFAISYNAKIPTIKKNFNIEAKLPDFDTGIFSSYVNEIAPGTVSFDIDEMPWNPRSLHEDVSYMLGIIEIAKDPDSWKQLDYSPNEQIIIPWLERFAEMIKKMD